jgi:phytoene dehydrogenase-like protein
MTDTHYDVIVLGTGPGGMSTATLLQKRGKKVLLVEKNNLLGGKMISIDKDGYAYDLFPHGQVPMRGNQFEAIFKELGVYEEYQPAIEPDDPRDIITLAYRRKDWKDYRLVTQKQAMADPTPFFNLFDIQDPAEQMQMINIMTEIVSLTPADLAKVDNVSMKDWLIARNCPDSLYNYMAFHSNASLAEPIDLCSASEQLLILQQIFLQGGGGQYKGGFGKLTEIMAREFEKNGGTLLKNCKAEKILVENGSVTGVKTSKGTFHAPVVVSGIGIQPTILKLVGEEHFDKAYVNYIKQLVPGWAFTSIRYFLNKEVMKTGMYVMWSDDSWWDTPRYKAIKQGKMPEEVILFMCNHSFYDENAAPPGKQVLVSGTVCTADPNAEEIQALYDVMDRQMQETFPEIWAACERREYNGPKEIRDLTRDSVLPKVGGECVGVAQIVGQCGQYKPKSEAPINGLYIAGADAGAEGMGTHQSALSGSRVADMVGVYLTKLDKF